jgi:hypothetical protein|nr:MAG TPA: hypothetical protein [Caudoviricetes sp.]
MSETRTATLTLEDLTLLYGILIDYIAKSNCTILTTDSKAIPKSFFDRLEIANNLREKLRKII